jgi:hypothetical protein
MNANHLVVTVEATHQSLQQRLEEATGPTDDAHPRRRHTVTDAFLTATSRHLGAVEEALLGEVRARMPEGDGRADAYLHEARHLELALARLKARLYGELHVAHLPWSEVWDQVHHQLHRHNQEEAGLVADLVAVLDDAESGSVAERLYRAELRAPTRAHPYIPHKGVLGHAARRIWSLADRFWDTAEGRTVPQPVRPRRKDRGHDSLVVQYLRGEPLFDATAPVLARRRHRHRPAPR